MTTKVNRNFLLQCEGHDDLAMAPACLPNAVLLLEGNWGLHPFYNCHTQLTPNWLSPIPLSLSLRKLLFVLAASAPTKAF